MNEGLLHAHSGLRWVVLVLLVSSIVTGFMNMAANKPYKKGLYAATMGMLHIQVILGIVLLVSKHFPLSQPMGEIMKNEQARFMIVEHPVMMLVAAVIATMGYSVGKRAQTDSLKHKRTAILFAIALVVVFLAIPWKTGGMF